MLHTVAQNSTEKTFSAEGISNIDLNGNSVFKITVQTTKTNTISIRSRVEGENSEQMVLVTTIEDNTLFIATNYQPLFQNENDKLSAHKVVSTELILLIPENMNINMYSDIASIIVKGQYKNALIELINGHCFLQTFSGAATVNSIQADITVKANWTIIDAFTKNGILNTEKIDPGKNVINVHSINGDITILKSQ